MPKDDDSILNDPYVENIHAELAELQRENDRLKIIVLVLAAVIVVSIFV